MFKSTKRFVGFSCAHRQPGHDGHCQYLHGYSRSFYFVFGTDEVDPRTHFVMDFSGLKGVKAWLDDTFDHTCLINADDPELELFKQLDERGIIQLRVLPNVSMEATAKYVA
ncbi:MAG: 6-carboxytetrahydropterin synthase, partial [Gammaproteobacteria bacterium]|nr:6-carboxytetrahydropterin synthase [Gammaproteobacteria bacterium]